jgi:hypothetical protein
MKSSPSETTSQRVFVGSRPSRDWSTYADLHRLADLHGTGVRLLQPDDRLEERRLADPVRADDADDAVARQVNAEVLDEHPVTEALLRLLDLDDGRAQPRARRDLDLLEVELAGPLGLRGHLLVALQPRLALRLARLGVRAHPLQLLLEAALQLGVLLALDLETFGLLLQVGRVVALVGVEPPAVDLERSTRRRCRGSTGRG